MNDKVVCGPLIPSQKNEICRIGTEDCSVQVNVSARMQGSHEQTDMVFHIIRFNVSDVTYEARNIKTA